MRDDKMCDREAMRLTNDCYLVTLRFNSGE